MQSLVGQSLGRYHVLEQLGEGGMAVVYKALDTRLERDVAIKIIRRDAFPPDQLELVLKRFEREAKSLARLSHPNIVKVLDYGEYEGSPYLILEHLPGGTLKGHMGRALAWQEAVRLLLPVARALAYAHQQGIIHRDVKPANILMTQSDEPMLTDFGIAKILEIGEGRTLTGSGIGIGTPDYMAPEQGMGSKVDARADIYSLGIIFYELVAGRKPYIADTPMAIVLKHMTDPLPRPANFAPDLPEFVENVIIKTLAKAPEDRYANMSEVVMAFEKLLVEATQLLPTPAKKAPTLPVIESVVEAQQPGPESLPASPKPPIIPPATTATVKPVFSGRSLRLVIGVVLLALLTLAGWLSAPWLRAALTTTTVLPTATQLFTQQPTSLPSNPDWLKTTEPGRFAFRCPDDALELCVNSENNFELERVKLTKGDGQPLGRIDEMGAWSPEGHRFVISVLKEQSSEHNLYLYDFSNHKLTLLANTGNNLFPAWSPDEKWIYYHSSCDARLMSPTGANNTMIGTGERPIYCSSSASWSPDSQMLARLLTPGDGTTSLKSVAIDNLKTKAATIVPWDLNTGQNVEGIEIAWMPNGAAVLVQIRKGDEKQTYQLKVACLQTTCTEKDWQRINFVIPETWMTYFYPRYGKETAQPLPTAAGSETSAKHIKIALQAPLSGALASAGTDIKRAAELALDQLSGPLKEMGFDIEFVPFDDQANPEIGVENARKLVADKAFLCGVGHLNSGVTISASEIYHTAGIPFISPTSTNPAVTDRGFLEMNRVIGRDDNQGVVGARYAQAQGFKNVFVVHTRDDYGKGLAEIFTQEAKRLGLQIIDVLAASEPKDFSAAATAITKAKPDLVFFGGAFDKGGPLFKQIREAGYQGVLMGGDGLDSPDLVRLGGPLLLNGGSVLYTSTLVNPSVYPDAAGFAGDFQGRFNAYPQPFAAPAYDAMGICLKAIETAARAKNGEIPARREVAEAIRALKDYKGITNVFTFNEKGDPVLSKYMVLKLVSAEPERWDKNEVIQVLEIAPPMP